MRHYKNNDRHGVVRGEGQVVRPCERHTCCQVQEDVPSPPHSETHISPATSCTLRSSSSSMILTLQSVSGVDTQRSAYP